MNKIILITILVLVSKFGMSQFGGATPNKLIQERFMATTTKFVLTGDEKFDKNFSDGLKEFWTLTEYEIVEDGTFSKTDTTVSYFEPVVMTVNYGEGVIKEYQSYALLMGGTESSIMRRMVAEVKLDSQNSELTLADAAYRAYGMPKMMQGFTQLRLDNKPISDYSISRIRYTTEKEYNKHVKNISKKTLLIDVGELEFRYKPIEKTPFISSYKGKVKFVNREEMEEAINSNDDEYCYLLRITNRQKNVIVVDCETGSIWYAYHHLTAKFLEPKDVKTIGKLAHR